MKKNRPQHGLLVTGTNTNVGKTYITALIAQQLIAQKTRTGIYKPVCTGAEIDKTGTPCWNDVQQLAKAMGHENDLILQKKICPQRFLQAAAPPVAAHSEKKKVDSKLLTNGLTSWKNDVEIMLVEGVGGLLCPLTETTTIADFAKEIGYPILIVAAVELGMINHTLLTIEVAQKRHIPVAGIIFNAISSDVTDEMIETNLHEIASRTEVPILSIVQQNQNFNLQTMNQQSKIDWLKLAKNRCGSECFSENVN